MVVATWVSMSVLVGAIVALLGATNLPESELQGSIVDGGEAPAIVFVRWFLLTFVCGAPLTWAVMALRARFVARRPQESPQLTLRNGLRAGHGWRMAGAPSGPPFLLHP